MIAPKTFEVMNEVGIDISDQASKSVRVLPYNEFDIVVTMGCGDKCPFVISKERLNWEIEDPIGKPIEVFRKVRDEIGIKVKELIENMEFMWNRGATRYPPAWQNIGNEPQPPIADLLAFDGSATWLK